MYYIVQISPPRLPLPAPAAKKMRQPYRRHRNGAGTAVREKTGASGLFARVKERLLVDPAEVCGRDPLTFFESPVKFGLYKPPDTASGSCCYNPTFS